MSKPVSYWDWIIGIGYGVYMTLTLLRFEEVISRDVMFVGWVIFVATLGLQAFRLSKVRKAEEIVSP